MFVIPKYAFPSYSFMKVLRKGDHSLALYASALLDRKYIIISDQPTNPFGSVQPNCSDRDNLWSVLAKTIKWFGRPFLYFLTHNFGFYISIYFKIIFNGSLAAISDSSMKMHLNVPQNRSLFWSVLAMLMVSRSLIHIITIQTYCIETKLTGDKTSEHMSKYVFLKSKLHYQVHVFGL